MNGIQFIDQITQNGDPLKIQNQIITSKVNLTKNIIAKGVVIVDCRFKDFVNIDNIDLNYGIFLFPIVKLAG
jgi:hypothetical protein